MINIFYPRKKDTCEKPFEFVRYSSEYEETRILEKLNNAWIESYKIRAFIPRYYRRSNIKRVQNAMDHTAPGIPAISYVKTRVYRTRRWLLTKRKQVLISKEGQRWSYSLTVILRTRSGWKTAIRLCRNVSVRRIITTRKSRRMRRAHVH